MTKKPKLALVVTSLALLAGCANMRTPAIYIVLLLFSSVAHGATISFVCKFPTYASPEGIKTQDPPFESSIVYDPKTKKAYLIGNVGSGEVLTVPNSAGVSFIEVTDSGNVQVTAITLSGEVVHSRHTIMRLPKGVELVPSQFYGTCRVQ